MHTQAMGYRELEHTADWELVVWAPDYPCLLEQAARGMYALAGVRLESAPRITFQIAVTADDAENLLVSFLADLLYLGEVEGVGFDKFALDYSEGRLIADMEGAPIASLQKEIKAVTYHNLTVRQTGTGYEVNIVFDV